MPKVLLKHGKSGTTTSGNRADDFVCNVPLSYITGNPKKTGLCGGPVVVGWTSGGASGRVCNSCHSRHCDDDDKFNLWDAYGVARPAKINPLENKFSPVPEDKPKPVKKPVQASIKADVPQNKPTYSKKIGGKKIVKVTKSDINNAVGSLLSDFF